MALPDRVSFADPETTHQIGALCPVGAVWRDLGVLGFQAVGGRAAVKKPLIFSDPL